MGPRRLGLDARDYGRSLLWASLLAAPLLATAALVDQQSPSLVVGLLLKASLACAVVTILAAPVVLRRRLSLRAIATEGLVGWPFRSLSALDVEAEAR